MIHDQSLSPFSSINCNQIQIGFHGAEATARHQALGLHTIYDEAWVSKLMHIVTHVSYSLMHVIVSCAVTESLSLCWDVGLLRWCRKE